MVSGKGQKIKGENQVFVLLFCSSLLAGLGGSASPYLERRCRHLGATASASFIITHTDSRPNSSPGSVSSVLLH